MRTKAVPMLRMILKRTSFPVLGTLVWENTPCCIPPQVQPQNWDVGSAIEVEVDKLAKLLYKGGVVHAPAA